MKRTLLIAALMITALSVCIAGQTSKQKSGKDEKAKNEVLALAREYADAFVKKDVTTLERILRDDYVHISSGLPQPKFLLLRFFNENGISNLPSLESIDFDENYKFVRVHGETAVLVTKITLKWQGSKEELLKKWKGVMPECDSYFVTLVAVKKNGVWKIISTHSSEYAVVIRVSPPPEN